MSTFYAFLCLSMTYLEVEVTLFINEKLKAIFTEDFYVVHHNYFIAGRQIKIQWTGNENNIHVLIETRFLLHKAEQ